MWCKYEADGDEYEAGKLASYVRKDLSLVEPEIGKSDPL